jgi:hypothetical protein
MMNSSVMRDRFHWARLLAFVTGLVNQELLLRNEYLAAENRILRGHLPSRLCLFATEPDFGLAKALGSEPVSSDPANTPTVTMGPTVPHGSRPRPEGNILSLSALRTGYKNAELLTTRVESVYCRYPQ